MLLIKDSVDLKELEKFGLRPHEKYPEIYVYKTDNHCLEIKAGEPIWFGLYTNDTNEIVDFNGMYFSMIPNEIADILFDLIQAGLVEKVDELEDE